MSQYLDRNQVIELYKKYQPYMATRIFAYEKALRELPVVEERPHGEWIYKDMKGQFCSVCDAQSVWKFNFCPNCGADMRKEQKRNCSFMDETCRDNPCDDCPSLRKEGEAE